MRSVQLFLALVWFESKRFRAYPTEIMANFLTRSSEAALFIVFWLIVGRYSGSSPINPTDVISYYLIMSGISPLLYLGFGIGSLTIKLIKSGDLNQVLIKPINPIVYPWAVRTGKNTFNILFGLTAAAVGIYLGGGMSAAAVPYLVPVLCNALLINAAFNLFIGTSGFYLTEAGGVKNAFLHVANLCRGSLIPLFLMPASVATLLQYTPFPASQYHLGILLQGRRLPDWKFVMIGLIWSVVLMWIALAFWKRSLRHYEATGI